MPAPITSSETLVNTTTTGDQMWAATAILADGGWIVVWMGRPFVGADFGVFAQRYDAAGLPVGGEFQVNSVTVDESEHIPSVAALPDGGWIVTWQTVSSQGNPTPDSALVYAQRYDATGVAVGGEVVVNSPNGYAGSLAPIVAVLADGGWVITWHQGVPGSNEEIFARRYDATGAPVGSPFQVSLALPPQQVDPSIAALADGGWIITWKSSGQDGSGWGVYAQRYNAAGTVVTGEFRVNGTTAGDQLDPSVTALADGGCIIAWSSAGQDGSGSGIYTQRYDAAGFAVGGETLVNTTTLNDQNNPSVVALPDGGWAVRWLSIEPGFDAPGARNAGLYVQRFDAGGNPVGAETRVATATESDHYTTAISALSDGTLLLAWTGPWGNDGSEYGIYALTLASPVNVINGTPDDDDLIGTPGDDAIYALAGNDTVLALSGDDTVDGGEGDDFLRGNEGNDTLLGGLDNDLIRGGLGDDTIDGGGGFDRVSHAQSAGEPPLPATGVTVSLLLQGAPQDTGHGMDTLIGIEALSGTPYDDMLTGDDNQNWLWTGHDEFGFTGNDTIIGNGGDDLIQASPGNHSLDGGAGIDTLSVWDNGTGASAPGASISLLLQGAAQDTRLGSMILSGFENLSGTNFDDELEGDGGDNVLAGYSGADFLQGGGGNDTLLGDGQILVDSPNGTSGPPITVDDVTVTYGDPGGDDTLVGGAGDDTLNGGDGDDFLLGDGNFLYNGPSGNDVLIGGGGNDVMRGGAGTDSFDGGDGIDRVSFFSAAATQGAVASLVTQMISNDGYGNAESMAGMEGLGGGTAFADHFTGDDNANELLGDFGDTLIGNDGDDNFFVTGATLIDGGSGVDTVEFFSRERLVPDTDFDGLAELESTLFGVDVDLRFNAINDDGFGNSGTIQNVENVTGSEFDDVLFGDHNANVLSGLGGADTLFGFGGDDTLDGGDGDDLLRGDGGAGYSGAGGNDTFLGGAGDDYMNGGPGADNYDGGDGLDRISFYAYAATQGAVASLLTQTITNDGFGNAETMVNVEGLGSGTAYADHFTGDDNANDLFGSIGDTIIAHGGDDHFQLEGAPALLDGGDGVDTLNTFVRFTIAPDSNADGLAEDLETTSGVEVDLLANSIVDDGFGNSGTIINVENVGGSEFDDALLGDHNANVLTGHGGADILFGRGADDTLDGGDGDDVLRGDGNPAYNGPSGNDTLIGGGGDDFMNGGAGVDSFDGGDGFDRISFFNYAATEAAIASLITQTITNDGFGNSETMIGVEGLGGGTAFADQFTGDDNANDIFGGIGDTLLANGGDDYLLLAGGPALVDGGAGIDTAEFFGDIGGTLVPDSDSDGLAELAFADHGVDVDLRFDAINDDGFGNSGTIQNVENVIGSSFDDALLGDEENNALTGLGGNDLIFGFGGDDTLDGGDGHDALRGDGFGNNPGPGGNDTLIGGGGNDYLNGGAGVDSYDGGDGFDRVSFFAGTATQGVLVDLSIGTVYNDGFGNAETIANVEALGGGTEFSDTFIGDHNANWLWGGSETGAAGDTLIGNAGDDLLMVFPGDHNLDGNDGVDTVSLFDNASGVTAAGASVSLLLQGAAQDTRQGMMILQGFENISGTTFDDELIGDDGDNVLAGDEGSDSLTGGAGNDTLLGDGRIGIDNPGFATGTIATFNEVTEIVAGGHGDDLLEGGLGGDTLIGGGGIDTASYEHATGPVDVNLGGGFADEYAADETYLSSDTLSGIENVIGSEFDDALVGDANANLLRGLGGNDLILGAGGDDTLEGGDGHDHLQGQQGNDSVHGGAGNDLLRGQDGDDLIDGGDGFDRFSDFAGATTGVTVSLLISGPQDTGHGIDTFVGIEALSGTPFDDHLTGDHGVNWFLVAGGGNDQVFGMGGDDLIELGAGDHLADGGLGIDTLSLRGNTTDIDSDGVTVSLLMQGAAQDTEQGMMTLTGFENLSGSIHDDILTGDGGANLLAGDEGSDALYGGGGDDTLLGDGHVRADTPPGAGTAGPPTIFNEVTQIVGPGPGDDWLEGGLGDDTLIGGGGVDTASYANASGGVEVDLIAGQSAGADGNDTLSGIENVTGSAFDDILVGDGADNRLEGGDGDDDLHGSLGNDQLFGNDGNDSLDASPGDDFVDGGEGHDVVLGRQGDDTLHGGGGHDFLRGGIGNDLIDGGTGFDRVSHYGAPGEGLPSTGVTVSLLLQGVPQDTGHGMDTYVGIEALSGSLFDDTLIGDHDANWLIGLDGTDTLIGNGGDDLLEAANGDHVLDGGAGVDTASLRGLGNAANGVSVSLLLQGGPQDTGVGMMTLTGFENVSGTQFDDSLTGDGNDNLLAGNEGADTLIGGAGNDTLYGDGSVRADSPTGGSGPITIFAEEPQIMGVGPGDDLLEGGLGDDTLVGGGGNDTASYANASGGVDVFLDSGTTSGADGDDTLSGIENVIGSEHDDGVLGDGNANALTGLGGNDLLFAGGGDDTVDGGEGHDNLRGNDGNDSVAGGAGHDFVRGGAGDDVLDGGDGFDRVGHFPGLGDAPITSGVTVSLLLQGVAQDTGQGWDILTGFEALSGTEFDDVLTGDDNANWILATAGNDTLSGEGGDDLIAVADGDHVMNGGLGIDTAAFAPDFATAAVNVSLGLQGAAQATGIGSMTLSGFENLSGTAFDDTLTGNTGVNLLAGDEGNDTLNGGDGSDTLYGDGRVNIDFPGIGTSGPIAIFVDIAAGNDTLNGGKGVDLLVGGGGDDLLTGGANLDTFEFGPGSGHDEITDFNKNGEIIRILDVPGVDDFSDLTLTLVGGDTLVSWDGGAATVLVRNVRPNQLDADNFEFTGAAAAAPAAFTFDDSDFSDSTGLVLPASHGGGLVGLAMVDLV